MCTRTLVTMDIKFNPESVYIILRTLPLNVLKNKAEKSFFINEYSHLLEFEKSRAKSCYLKRSKPDKVKKCLILMISSRQFQLFYSFIKFQINEPKVKILLCIF